MLFFIYDPNYFIKFLNTYIYTHTHTTYFTPSAPAHALESTKSVRCMRTAQAHTHTHSHVCVCVCVFVSIHTHTHTHEYIHSHSQTLSHKHTHTHSFPNTRTQTQMCVYIYIGHLLRASPPAAACACAGDRRPRESPVLSASARRYATAPSQTALPTQCPA